METNITGEYKMKSANRVSRGFTLVASLLMLLLLSGIAIGLLMMVNTEGKVGGTDMQNNLAYHAAEGGIEKMSSDLSFTFQNAQSPTAAQICGIGGPLLGGSTSNEPSLVGVSWKDYTVVPGSNATATSCPTTSMSSLMQWSQLSTGPNAGLYAQIIPVSMLATAAVPGGQEVSMMRAAQVALIPVFQFGVFSEGDLGFYSSPNLTFAGRVHTNADLYLGVASGAQLVFENKLEAYGNVVTAQLPNGLSSASYNDTGNVYIPTLANGCLSSTGAVSTSTNCVLKNTNGDSTYGQGSVTGGGSATAQTGSSYNATNWNPFSKTSTNYMLINGNYGSKTQAGTGAKKLSMPFVNGTAYPYEIIRRPPSTESATTPLGEAREYNMAQIRVLLTDDPAELPGGASDSNNVRLANVGGTTPSNQYGIATSTSGMPALGAGSSYVTMFAQAWNYVADPTNCAGTYCTSANANLPQDWPQSPQQAPSGYATLVPTNAPVGSYGNRANPSPTLTVCGGGTSSTSGCVFPYYTVSANSSNTAYWNLIDGYLRVEYRNAAGTWTPVTMEWLQLGFARGTWAPTSANPNPINPNAILIFQEPADRNGDGAVDTAGLTAHCLTHNSGGTCTSWSYALPPEVWQDSPATSGSPWYGVLNSTTSAPSITANNWYPINFYDAREGEPRDVTQTGANANSCTSMGVMNAVELDVGNLKNWLTGTIGTSGSSVDYAAQNGYVLYFSDRRGMLPSPNAVSVHAMNTKTGDSGFEDIVNSGSSAGTPDGSLEAIPTGRTYSPEDVNQNGLLDTFGTNNLGLGQWNGTVNQNQQINAASPDNPYSPRITSCQTTGRKNWVSGARHVLKLVDGTLGNVPTAPSSAAVTYNGVTYNGGFTVASENPVYIQGDYNSNSGDTFWAGNGDQSGHSAAAVIADSVTVLSNAWQDRFSMENTPTQAAGNRNATTTYYRLAIAGGKNMNFPFPSWSSSTNYGFGTDGGVHNFLRFLEDWSGQTLNYGGSLVSLYYATYNTGLFKCCNYAVYQPPTRNYIFDSDFTYPAGLPPGTPMFRDVEALSYRQLFTARSN